MVLPQQVLICHLAKPTSGRPQSNGQILKRGRQQTPKRQQGSERTKWSELKKSKYRPIYTQAGRSSVNNPIFQNLAPVVRNSVKFSLSSARFVKVGTIQELFRIYNT